MNEKMKLAENTTSKESVSAWLDKELRSYALELAGKGRDSMPSERELASRFQVNRLTLRKSLSRLTKANILTTTRNGRKRVNEALCAARLEMRKANETVYSPTPFNSSITTTFALGSFEHPHCNKEYWDDRFRRFAMDWPGTSITPVALSRDDLAMIEDVDSLPDVFNINAPDIVSLADRHLLFELDELCQRFFDNGSVFDPKMLDACRHDGKLYGLPQEASVPVLYCNVELLEKIGFSIGDVSWSAFPEMALAAREKLPEGTELLALPCIYTLLIAFGVFAAEKKMDTRAYESENAALLMNWFERMASIPRSILFTSQADEEPLDKFLRGDLVFYLQASHMSSHMKGTIGFEMATIPMPCMENAFGDVNVVAWAIRRDSPRVMHACRWLAYILNENNQNQAANHGRNIPANISAQTIYKNTSEDSKIAFDSFVRFQTNRLPTNYWQVLERDVWVPQMLRFWNGKQKATATMSRMRNEHEFIDSQVKKGTILR